MRSKTLTGAFGATVLTLTPRIKREMEFDVENCPHCGVHHASLHAEVSTRGEQQTAIIRCPTDRRAPMYVQIRLSAVADAEEDPCQSVRCTRYR